MRKSKSAYELASSQVDTPRDVVSLFWEITHKYRLHFSNILDLGAGDGRFAFGGKFTQYEGIEIDPPRWATIQLPKKASILQGCAFQHRGNGYDACIGNPPYVRHHDLDELWRDRIATRLSKSAGVNINRKCNLYVYFLFLALIKAKRDGLVSTLVPYEWVSRPSANPLREYIKRNSWHVDIYRFSEPVFDDVLTTCSITIIDKRNRDGKWNYFQIDESGNFSELNQMTGSRHNILPYQKRGKIWAMRGMSPGTQKVFTLTEGERIHAGLRLTDVLPCVTSLRHIPKFLSRLTWKTFKRHFVDAGAKCWLIKSHSNSISPRLRVYLDNVPKTQRDTWTCNSRPSWFIYPLAKAPCLLISTGFTAFGPKILVNSIKAHAVGSICGVYSNDGIAWSQLQKYLQRIDFEKRVVPHSNQLKKIEIRQLNAVLNKYWLERIGHA